MVESSSRRGCAREVIGGGSSSDINGVVNFLAGKVPDGLEGVCSGGIGEEADRQIVGFVTPEFAGMLPGCLSPSVGIKFMGMLFCLAAISKVPTAGWAQVFAFISAQKGIMEPQLLDVTAKPAVSLDCFSVVSVTLFLGQFDRIVTFAFEDTGLFRDFGICACELFGLFSDEVLELAPGVRFTKVVVHYTA